MCKYYISKKKHCKEKINALTLHFSNGDDLCITKGEIADLQLQLYDRLVCYGKQTSAVVASCFIKLKIQQNTPSVRDVSPVPVPDSDFSLSPQETSIASIKSARSTIIIFLNIYSASVRF